MLTCEPYLSLAHLSNSARRMSSSSDRLAAGKHVSNHCNFKMMLWLVIFYEFYDKGVCYFTIVHVHNTCTVYIPSLMLYAHPFMYTYIYIPPATVSQPV